MGTAGPVLRRASMSSPNEASLNTVGSNATRMYSPSEDETPDLLELRWTQSDDAKWIEWLKAMKREAESEVRYYRISKFPDEASLKYGIHRKMANR